MQILWICGSAVVGGAERATLRVLASLRERSHRVAALCAPGSRLLRALSAERITAEEAPLAGRLNVRAIVAIARSLAATTPDVALVTGADEWVWACLSPRPRPQTRLVLVRHMALPLPRRVRWLAGRRADAVVAVSDAVRESLRGGGIPEGRLHVIYNPSRFAPRSVLPTALERGRARQALGLPQTGHWVGFFGGRDPNKGLADVLHAVERANQELGETHLLLCGRRAPRATLVDPTHCVHDLGEIDAVEQAMTAADVVVMATHSRLGEALPATLVEAMSCGTPVAAYAGTGMSEVIGADGHAGRLATADDPDDLARVLGEILRDPAHAARLATAGLERARTLFDPRRAADSYERLFYRDERI